MKKKVLENYRQIAAWAGLRFDGQSGLIYGDCGGYAIRVYAESESYPYLFTVAVSAKRPDGPLPKETVKTFIKEHKPVRDIVQEGFLIKMPLANLGSELEAAGKLKENIAAFTQFLWANQFQGCCQTCGETQPTKPCVAGTAFLGLCDNCFVNLQQNETVRQTQLKQKKENIVGGVVGALLGSLLGVACILIISQLGYVAAISGVVMAVCTLKGYELLGGKLSTKGIIIGSVIIIGMIYLGNQLDWAILLMQELELGLGDAFRAVPLLLQEEIIEPTDYWSNLAMVYLFAAAGAVPTLYSALKNQKKNQSVYRLEETPVQAGPELP